MSQTLLRLLRQQRVLHQLQLRRLRKCHRQQRPHQKVLRRCRRQKPFGNEDQHQFGQRLWLQLHKVKLPQKVLRMLQSRQALQ